MPKHVGAVLLHGFDVDRNSPVPIYRQIETALRRLILDGTLPSSRKLPSTRDLASELGVSRITIKSVYEQLIAEGYLNAKTGSGTFVTAGLALETAPKVRAPFRAINTPQIDLPDHATPILSSKASVRHGATAPFRPGVPALDLFPLKLWMKYTSEAAQKDTRQNLSYGDVIGSKALRAAIARHLTDARGMQVDAEEIVITSGAQQAFVLIAFVLLNRRDTVWYENPGHIAGRDVMQIMGANVAPVPIDGEGMDIRHAAREHPKPKAIFTTPSHQQPLGVTMSLSRRLALLQYAKDNDAWIIEDDYDSEFRYRGRPLPALSALDRERRVFYVGTFSKSMFAAMRLGYIVVPHGLSDAFAKAKNLLGQSTSAVVEQAMADFMDDGRFVEHIRKMRRAYRDRRDVLFDSLSTECSGLLTPQITDAGMHMLAWLHQGVDDQAAHRALLEEGIESLPLSVYSVTPLNRPALVLGFSGASERQIPKLVKRLSQTLEKRTPLS
ncbi:PLP-dependent aminotransferase family protein [Roseovarius sp. 2305UL8-3]|uniref:MocR-like pyridoxine biosynthesis transcription factor PdxR n=1 Tax=Roseovarius conchicola TaxID=3121636 RepID=UPI0035290EC5